MESWEENTRKMVETARHKVFAMLGTDWEYTKVHETDVLFYIAVHKEDYNLSNVKSLYLNINYISEPVTVNDVKVG